MSDQKWTNADGKPIATSGKITISPDGTSTRKSFYDQPLTKDENKAVAWFTEMSPHEQLREVRRMKWNLDVRTKDAETWKRVAGQQAEELAQLRAKLSTYTPEGFSMPPAAEELLSTAAAHGWKNVRSWSSEEDTAQLRIKIGNGAWTFELSWAVDKRGARMVRRGLARSPGRNWYDAPSLKAIKKIIEEEI